MKPNVGIGTLARKAVSLDDKAHGAYIVLGFSEVWLGRYERGLDSLRRAIKRDPIAGDGHAHLGIAHIFAGRAEEGLAGIETAMLFNPHYPSWYGLVLGRAKFILGDYQGAEQAFVEVLQSTPEYPSPRAHLAATLAAMGRLDEARAEIIDLIKVSPGYTLRNLPKSLPFKNREDLDRFLDALRQAGLPES